MDLYLSRVIVLAFMPVIMMLAYGAYDLSVRYFRRKAGVETASVWETVKDSLRSSWISIPVFALVIAAMLTLRPSIVVGTSMDSTLHSGQLLLTKQADPEKEPICRGDIVTLQVDGNILVKRVVGVPGDLVLIKDGELYINATHIQENYIAEPMVPTAQAHFWQLSEGRYFVLGDNRNVSYDSRYFGSVQQDNILSVVQAGFSFQGMTVFSPPTALDSIAYRDLY